jgi:hypothetical protein
MMRNQIRTLQAECWPSKSAQGQAAKRANPVHVGLLGERALSLGRSRHERRAATVRQLDRTCTLSDRASETRHLEDPLRLRGCADGVVGRRLLDEADAWHRDRESRNPSDPSGACSSGSALQRPSARREVGCSANIGVSPPRTESTYALSGAPADARERPADRQRRSHLYAAGPHVVAREDHAIATGPSANRRRQTASTPPTPDHLDSASSAAPDRSAFATNPRAPLCVTS